MQEARHCAADAAVPPRVPLRLAADGDSLRRRKRLRHGGRRARHDAAVVLNENRAFEEAFKYAAHEPEDCEFLSLELMPTNYSKHSEEDLFPEMSATDPPARPGTPEKHESWIRVVKL